MADRYRLLTHLQTYLEQQHTEHSVLRGFLMGNPAEQIQGIAEILGAEKANMWIQKIGKRKQETHPDDAPYHLFTSYCSHTELRSDLTERFELDDRSYLRQVVHLSDQVIIRRGTFQGAQGKYNSPGALIAHTRYDGTRFIVTLSGKQNSKNYTESDRQFAQEALSFVTARLRNVHKYTTDGLTGLVSREVWRTHLRTKLLTDAQEYPEGVAILGMYDLDHFKQDNDTYGHGYGDLVIQAVANILMHSVRTDHDLIYRVAGDENGSEVSLASAELALSTAARIAAKNTRGVRSLTHDLNGNPLKRTYTLSNGVYILPFDRILEQKELSFEPRRDGEDPNLSDFRVQRNPLDVADIAVYMAKGDKFSFEVAEEREDKFALEQVMNENGRDRCMIINGLEVHGDIPTVYFVHEPKDSEIELVKVLPTFTGEK